MGTRMERTTLYSPGRCVSLAELNPRPEVSTVSNGKGVVAPACNPSTWRLRQEGQCKLSLPGLRSEFKASLSCVMRLSQRQTPSPQHPWGASLPRESCQSLSP